MAATHVRLADIRGKEVRAVIDDGFVAITFTDDTYVYLEAESDGFGDDSVAIYDQSRASVAYVPKRQAVEAGLWTEAEYDELAAEAAKLRAQRERLQYERLKAKFEPVAAPATQG